MNLTLAQMKLLVDEKIDMATLLGKVYPDRRYVPGQKCFCPFHDNQHTESAALYQDEDTGKVTLWCFSEKEQYTSSNVIETLLKKDVYAKADLIWSKMSDAQRNSWLASHSFNNNYAEMFSTVDQEEQESSKPTKAQREFKSGKVGVKDLLGSYMHPDE